MPASLLTPAPVEGLYIFVIWGCYGVYWQRYMWGGWFWYILVQNPVEGTYAFEVSWDIIVSIGIKSGTYVYITTYATHIYKLNLLRYFQVLHSGLEPQSINQLPHRPKDLLTEEFVFLSWSQTICITCLFIFKLIPLCWVNDNGLGQRWQRALKLQTLPSLS